MTKPKPQERPGDVFLDRYMPNASEEEREEARRNLYRFFGALVAIAKRHTREEWDKAYGIRANSRLGVQ